MLPLTNCIVAIGQTPPQDMGGLDDRRQFQASFSPFPDPSKVRLIVTPNFSTSWTASTPGAAPVCIITELSATNFTAQATNMSEKGTSGKPILSLNWLAIEESPPPAAPQTNVRMGLTIPQFYVPQNFPNSNQGWWQQTSPGLPRPSVANSPSSFSRLQIHSAPSSTRLLSLAQFTHLALQASKWPGSAPIRRRLLRVQLRRSGLYTDIRST
jgi:hypothetical protein